MKIICPSLNHIEDIDEFLEKFCKEFPETNYEDGTIQCEAGRRRSVDDLYEIVSEKFNIEYNDFLFKLNDALIRIHKGLMYCPDIGKVVVSVSSHYPTTYERYFDDEIAILFPDNFDELKENCKHNKNDIYKILKHERNILQES